MKRAEENQISSAAETAHGPPKIYSKSVRSSLAPTLIGRVHLSGRHQAWAETPARARFLVAARSPPCTRTLAPPPRNQPPINPSAEPPSPLFSSPPESSRGRRNSSSEPQHLPPCKHDFGHTRGLCRPFVVPLSPYHLSTSTDALYLSIFVENLAERRVAKLTVACAAPAAPLPFLWKRPRTTFMFLRSPHPPAHRRGLSIS
jgi:hypothetical protein